MSRTPLPAASPSGLLTLIVDQDPADAERVRQALRGVPGIHSTHHAGRGEEALEWLRALDATRLTRTLVFVDASASAPDGIGLLRTIRSDPQLAGLPVILLSAARSPSDRSQLSALDRAGLMHTSMTEDALAWSLRWTVAYWARVAAALPAGNRPVRVLILECDAADGELMLDELRRALPQVEVERVTARAGFEQSLERVEHDLILLDYALPGRSGAEALALVRRHCPGTPVVVVSGALGEDIAVEILRQGATDYVLKTSIERLGPVAQRALVELADRRDHESAQEALRESETRLRQVTESMSEVFWLTDVRRSCAIYISPAYERVWGRSCADLFADTQSWLESIHPDDRAKVVASVPEQLRGPRAIDYRIIRPDGEVRWIHDRSFPVLDADGRVVRVAGVAADVTERRQAEGALRTNISHQTALRELSQEALGGSSVAHLLARATVDIVAQLGVDTCHVLECAPPGPDLVVRAAAGPTCLPIGAPAASSVAGSPHGAALTSERDVVFVRDVAERTGPWLVPPAWVERGVRSAACVRIMGPEGPFGVLEVTCRSSRDPTAEDLAFLQTAAGLLELELARSRYVEALEHSEQRFRQLADAAPTMLWITDLETGCTFVSRGWVEFTGLPLHAHLGLGWLGAFHPDDRTLVEAAYDSAVERGESFQVEARTRYRDGAYRWLLTAGSPRRAREGRVEGFIGTCIDIHDRHVAQQALWQSEIQLRQAQKMEAVGRLAGGVAHDFNNLLSVINGYAELALARLRPEDVLRRHLVEIARAGQRAAGLTRQLLVFSRKQASAPRVLDLNGLIVELERMLPRLIGEDVELVLRLGTSPLMIEADPGQIEQVLLNLAINARDAMPQGGRLEIATTVTDVSAGPTSEHPDIPPGPYVVLSVADSGCGMAPQVQEHIFEPFFTTKEPGKGTGLGLSTVYGIVQGCGGRVDVDSAVGVGSTFHVWLPRVSAPATEVSQPELPPLRRGSETILLVEDEPAVRALAAEVLELYGYRVIAADSSSSALPLADQHRGEIALLLTDVVLPGLSGPELARRLRSQIPGLRVLYTSGYTRDMIVLHGVGADATALVHKPFTPEGLARRVRAVLDEPAVPGPGPPA